MVDMYVVNAFKYSLTYDISVLSNIMAKLLITKVVLIFSTILAVTSLSLAGLGTEDYVPEVKVTFKPVSLTTEEQFSLLRTSVTPDMIKNKQVSCLAKNLWYESRGEGWDGMLAVAKVTLNRVTHERFQDSVCAVVYSRSKTVCQFSWVCETLHPPSGKLWQEIQEFAATIYYFNDRYLDLTKGALFFHTTDTVSPKSSRKRVTVLVGRHVFYGYTHLEKN
jgi:hypothetical protein